MFVELDFCFWSEKNLNQMKPVMTAVFIYNWFHQAHDRQRKFTQPQQSEISHYGFCKLVQMATQRYKDYFWPPQQLTRLSKTFDIVKHPLNGLSWGKKHLWIIADICGNFLSNSEKQ